MLTPFQIFENDNVNAHLNKTKQKIIFVAHLLLICVKKLNVEYNSLNLNANTKKIIQN